MKLDGGIEVKQELSPLFSHSELLTVRLPLPFSLNGVSYAGTLQVSKDGFGMRTGDVLRACSTYEARKATGLFGLFPSASAPPARNLFLADGQPYDRVVEALTANTVERGARDIVLVVERELPASGPFDRDAAGL